MKWYERLSQAREAKGIKKAHFAKAIGVQAPTITEWERGDVVSPSSANVMKICKVLNITPEWLMQGNSHGDDGIPTQTYFGANADIAEAVRLMENMPAYELGQAIAIIRTLSTTQRPIPGAAA